MVFAGGFDSRGRCNLKKTDEEMSKEELVKWMREADDIMVPTQRSAEKWDYTPLLPDVQPAVLTLQANEK